MPRRLHGGHGYLREGGDSGRLHARARLPFADDVTAFLESHQLNFIVEQNRDAQLRSLLTLETGVPLDKLESVRYYGGFPMSALHVCPG